MKHLGGMSYFDLDMLLNKRELGLGVLEFLTS
jgi:hypothetical protein